MMHSVACLFVIGISLRGIIIIYCSVGEQLHMNMYFNIYIYIYTVYKYIT